MDFLKKLFGKKEQQINTYADFWNWFLTNEHTFFKVIKTGKNIERNFFSPLSTKLDALKEGIFYLTGMCDDSIAELILTPDGAIKNIAFVEELINTAPHLPNWKFTALKPALDIKNVAINMGNYTFEEENLWFYPIEHHRYPDEVDLVIVYGPYKEIHKSAISNGIYIFLDNYLGELNAVTTIDNMDIISKEQAENELIPMGKLKDYLIWREKEFVEKYSGSRYDTENDTYSSLTATLKNGLPLVAIVNTTLLEWDSKASHPWILRVEISYEGKERNGMPDRPTYDLLDIFEDDIRLELKDFDGYLNIGRETADNTREIYFACKDFRKPSKVMHSLESKYAGKVDWTYKLYKDKYWQSFERFRPQLA